MKIIRIQTANNIPNLFYKVMPELAYNRVPSKTLISEGIMDIKPYNNKTLEAMRQALVRLGAVFTEVEE